MKFMDDAMLISICKKMLMSDSMHRAADQTVKLSK